METITSGRMRALEINCEYSGLSRLQLMENAGAALAAAIKKRFRGGSITIVAGRGNNGGDAFVAARHLQEFDVETQLLGSASGIKTKEARRNWDILEKMDAKLREITDSRDLGEPDADIIIDAIFGTGVRGRIREPESAAIELINGSRAFVVSVDVPSGLDPDSGEFEKAVKSALTVTFHRVKPGLLTPSGKEHAGEIEVAGIGIPAQALLFTGPGDVAPLLYRAPESHKGDAGRVLVIGGGAYTGAPALAALAALRTGADIATVAAPESVSGVIAAFSPDLIVRPLTGDVLAEEHLPYITELIERHDVVVIGMGLGRNEDTLRAVRQIIPQCKRAVVDADALFALETPLSGYGRGIIITPHAGEMGRLAGSVPDEWRERLEFSREFASVNDAVVLLKGHYDVISDGNDVRANRTGNPGMTVGGTGDVLAGVVGALYAKHDALAAASAGAFINGLAGDIAFSRKGYSLLATDVIDCIPDALRECNRYA